MRGSQARLMGREVLPVNGILGARFSPHNIITSWCQLGLVGKCRQVATLFWEKRWVSECVQTAPGVQTGNPPALSYQVIMPPMLDFLGGGGGGQFLDRSALHYGISTVWVPCFCVCVFFVYDT